MSSSTTTWSMPYSQPADTVASVAATMQALATRADLLLGESGTATISHTAGVVGSVNITLSRTYPGSTAPFGSLAAGILTITPITAVASGTSVFYWIGGWAGTSSTITGFTVSGMSSNTVSRSFVWSFRPASP